MAASSGGKMSLPRFGKILMSQKASIIQDLDINHAMSALWSMFSRSEELDITSATDAAAKSETFLGILSRKNAQCFQDFCNYLEKNLPHLLTKLVLESSVSTDSTADDDVQHSTAAAASTGSASASSSSVLPPTQSLQLSLELALKERDSVLREKTKAIEEREEMRRQLQELRTKQGEASATGDVDSTGTGQDTRTSVATLRSGTTASTHSTPTSGARENGYKDATYGTWPDKVGILDSQTIDKGNERVIWETHRIILQKLPGCGFGIAISGGRDNPHFSGGDPAIAVSDVIKGGPAEGKLCTNDRLMSVNGQSLDNVDHAYAISILKEGGNVADLIVKRRIGPHPIQTAGAIADSPISNKVTLTRKNRRDDFGLVIGHKLYVKDIRPGSLAAQSGAIKEGDIILKINDASADSLSLADARKLIEKLGRSSSDKLSLLLQPMSAAAAHVMPRYSSSTSLHKRQNSDLDVAAGRPQIGMGSSSDGFKDQQAYATNTAPLSPALRKADYEKPRIRGYSSSAAPIPYGTSVAAVVQQQQQLAHSWHQQQLHSAFSGDYGVMSKSVSHQPLRQQQTEPLGDYGLNGMMPASFDSPSTARDGIYMRAAAAGGFIKPRNDLQGDIHYVSFRKDGSLGIRIAGGNKTGIFVSAVQDGSSAYTEGLREGDEIVKVDGRPVSGMTRDEVLTAILAAGEEVAVATRPRSSSDRYDAFLATAGSRAGSSGDLFYIRTHFVYDESASAAKGHLSFAVGDVFRVTDTLVNGEVGEWAVERLPRIADVRVDSAEALQAIVVGFIPSAARAELLAAATSATTTASSGAGEPVTPTEKDSAGSSKGGLGGFFRRRSSRRTKSLSKDHWDDVVFVDADENSSTTKFPAYERIEYHTKLGFVRPVVIFGSLADVARDKLCRERPDMYESLQPLAAGSIQGTDAAPPSGAQPEAAASATGAAAASSSSGIVHLAAVRGAMNRGRHCVLDVTPSAVDRLNYAQYAPIVVLLRTASKAAVKELRERWALGSRKSSRKLHEQAMRIEASFAHLLTAIVDVQPGDNGAWFETLHAVVSQQQQQAVWMSEVRSVAGVGAPVASGGGGGSGLGRASTAFAGGSGGSSGADDFLFPMSNRLSYVASPGSDLDLTRSSVYYDDSAVIDGGGRHAMASSAGVTRSSSDPNLAGVHPEDRYYPSYYGREVATHQTHQHGDHTQATDGRGTLNQEQWHERLEARNGWAKQLQQQHQQQGSGGAQPPPSASDPSTKLYSRPNPPYGSRLPGFGTALDPSKYVQDQHAAQSGYAAYEAYNVNRHDDFKAEAAAVSSGAEYRSPPFLSAGSANTPYRFTRFTSAAAGGSHSTYSRPSPAKPLSMSVYHASRADPAPAVSEDSTANHGRRVSAYAAGQYESWRDHHYASASAAISLDSSGSAATAPALPSSSAGLLSSSVPDDQKMSSHYRSHADAGPSGPMYPGARQPPHRSASMSASPAVAAAALAGQSRGDRAVRQSVASSAHAQMLKGHSAAASTSQAPPWTAASSSPRAGSRPGGSLVPRSSASLRTGASLAAAVAAADFDPVGGPRSFANAVYMEHSELMRPSGTSDGGAGAIGRVENLETQKRFLPSDRYDSASSHLRRDAIAAAPSPGSAFESYRRPANADVVESAASWSQGDGGSGTQEQSDQQQPPNRELAYERGVFDENGGRLESVETGVSLYIPPGALPPGSQQEVYFRVCEQDRTLPLPLREPGETILSPMVMCGPEGLTFLRPVQLRLPHAASGGLDSWQLSLNAAEASGKGDWQALAVDGGPPSATAQQHRQAGMASVALTAADDNARAGGGGNSTKANVLTVEVDHF